MEDIYTLQRSRTVSERQIRTNINGNKYSPAKTLTSPVIERLLVEGGENFFHYLSWFGLVNDPDLLILSSKNHYYYDCDDLKGVKTLINLKMLNMIKHLDSFIHVVNNVISPKTNFIGCFCDRNSQSRAGLPKRIYKRLLNFIDSRVFIEMDKKDFSLLMESNGFKVIDMTEMNGITYFITQNNSSG
jgi:hypothetical protein